MPFRPPVLLPCSQPSKPKPPCGPWRCPGLGTYRLARVQRLGGTTSVTSPPAQIIHDQDAAGGLVREFIFRTNLPLPHIPVFIRLDGGRWSPGAAQRLPTTPRTTP